LALTITAVLHNFCLIVSERGQNRTVGIISTSCLKSVTVVLSYMKALKLWPFEDLLKVDFWPYFTAHVQNGHFPSFGDSSDNGVGFPVSVENFDDQEAIIVKL